MENSKRGAIMDAKKTRTQPESKQPPSSQPPAPQPPAPPPGKKPLKNIRESKAWQQTIGAIQNVFGNYGNFLKRSFQAMPRDEQCQLITKYCQIITPGVAATALTFFYPFLPLFVKIVTVPTVLIVAWWLGGRVVSRVVIERMDKFLNRK
jgi:hypothetical protein